MSKDKKKKKGSIKAAERQVLDAMQELDPKSDEYGKLAQRLKLIEEARKESGSTKVSKDTIAKGAITLASTGLLLAFEHNNPITSKLLSFIPKVKI